MVKQSKLTFLPDQVGGKFHTAVVLLENKSDQMAVDVSGQLSILDENGKLVQSLNPNAANIPAGGQGLFIEDALDLPKPVKNGKLDVMVTARFVDDGESPVTIRNTGVDEDQFGGCSLRGTISNTLDKQASDLEIRAASLADGRLVSGGFTFVDTVLPGQDATFKIDLFSPAQCASDVDRVVAFPNSVGLGRPLRGDQ